MAFAQTQGDLADFIRSEVALRPTPAVAACLLALILYYKYYYGLVMGPQFQDAPMGFIDLLIGFIKLGAPIIVGAGFYKGWKLSYSFQLSTTAWLLVFLYSVIFNEYEWSKVHPGAMQCYAVLITTYPLVALSVVFAYRIARGFRGLFFLIQKRDDV
jgi:hypothetical protein